MFRSQTTGRAACDFTKRKHEPIAQIPGYISFVRLADVEVDLCGSGAMVTGIQHAQVVVDGQVIPRIRGSAYVNAEATLLLDPADPFAAGIR